MISIRIISISKTPKGPYDVLKKTYEARLKPFARLQMIEIKESRFQSIHDRERVQKEEGEKIITSLKSESSFVIALDAKGKNPSSENFAKILKEKEDLGITLTFIIGGPLGLSQACKDQADLVLSLSPMTFPHDLAKIVLLEQIYRASTIIHGKTYHY